MRGTRWLLPLLLVLMAGDAPNVTAQTRTERLDPIVWTPSGCDPDAAGEPTTTCPDFFPARRVMLLAVRMVDGATRERYMRVFGVDENKNVLYVLDTSPALFGTLLGEYLNSLGYETDNSLGGGLAGEVGVGPVVDGPPGQDPPTAAMVKKVKHTANVMLAGMEAMRL